MLKLTKKYGKFLHLKTSIFSWTKPCSSRNVITIKRGVAFSSFHYIQSENQNVTSYLLSRPFVQNSKWINISTPILSKSNKPAGLPSTECLTSITKQIRTQSLSNGSMERAQLVNPILKKLGEQHNSGRTFSNKKITEYHLETFHRSNQDTCLNHKPLVNEGDWVQRGEILTDCSSSVGGELSLGQNLLIAYMPWEGYNFEDAILISERLVRDDLYTSVHIERYEIEPKETKLGIEEITRDIPDVAAQELEHLDARGIAKLGSWIEEGDILIGKITPINKKAQSPYQKLLYTILEKDFLPIRDTSLRAPRGIKAKVIDIQIFQKKQKNEIPKLNKLKKEKLSIKTTGVTKVLDRRGDETINIGQSIRSTAEYSYLDPKSNLINKRKNKYSLNFNVNSTPRIYEKEKKQSYALVRIKKRNKKKLNAIDRFNATYRSVKRLSKAKWSRKSSTLVVVSRSSTPMLFGSKPRPRNKQSKLSKHLASNSSYSIGRLVALRTSRPSKIYSSTNSKALQRSSIFADKRELLLLPRSARSKLNCSLFQFPSYTTRKKILVNLSYSKANSAERGPDKAITSFARPVEKSPLRGRILQKRYVQSAPTFGKIYKPLVLLLRNRSFAPPPLPYGQRYKPSGEIFRPSGQTKQERLHPFILHTSAKVVSRLANFDSFSWELLKPSLRRYMCRATSSARSNRIGGATISLVYRPRTSLSCFALSKARDTWEEAPSRPTWCYAPDTWNRCASRTPSSSRETLSSQETLSNSRKVNSLRPLVKHEILGWKPRQGGPGARHHILESAARRRRRSYKYGEASLAKLSKDGNSKKIPQRQNVFGVGFSSGAKHWRTYLKQSSTLLRPRYLERSDNTLSSSNISTIQIFLAEKRKIQIGDKMAGRHGNKGIVSQILPVADMPYLPNGSAIDMVLNPLGVPSRMNVGQIYECLLGLAGKFLGENYKIFPFDEIYGAEASRSFVFSKLYEARKKTGYNWLFNPDSPGKIRIYDGRTGEGYDQPVTVGIAYMLRLVHMVDDKIHMRSTGPYSLVTQQPLRGRSKQGGQRLGEMEVWALEGYGAAFTLLEMLTIKSDDMTGRMTLWSNLIRNKDISIGTPESFKVLVCELQALCLDIGIFRYKNTASQRKNKTVSNNSQVSGATRENEVFVDEIHEEAKRNKISPDSQKSESKSKQNKIRTSTNNSTYTLIEINNLMNLP